MTATKVTRTETTDAITKLREMLPPGSTVYTIVRRVSQSGMSRHISVVLPHGREINDITYLVARALEMKRDLDTGGIVMRGAGMDMGFALVYDLSHVLYPDGFGCIGPACPSNDHRNGDRNYVPHIANGMDDHWHTSGGYAISHRSL